MALKLKGSTSGFVGLDAPAVSGNNTLILPENSGSAFQLFANDITAGVTTFTTVTVNRNGDLTVPGTISIGGTLTYEDVTNVDSVGVVTARGLSIFGNTTGLNVASGISTFQGISLSGDTSGLSVSGIATFGTSLLVPDSIIHTGDTDTKIRFPSADTFTVETGGTERLRIDSTGRLLFNNADSYHGDADDFVLKERSGGNVGMTFQNTGTGYGVIYFADNSSTTVGRIQYDHTNDTLDLFAGGGERLHINSSGTKITGILTVTDYIELQNDNLYIQDSITHSGDTNTKFGFSNNDEFRVEVGGSQKLFVNTTGINVTGILTATDLVPTGSPLSHRNVIVNGSMLIGQRGNDFTSITATAYHLDGFQLYYQNSSAAFRVRHSGDGPDGFHQSLRINCTTADTSIASNEEVKLMHKIEGFQLQRFAKGTSSAKAFALSFYVKCNKTGTYIVELYDRDNGRDVSGSYTVSNSNWNRYTIVFPADTTGEFDFDHSSSLEIYFWLVAGSAVQGGSLNTAWRSASDPSSATGQVNFTDSTSNEWMLTGVQLETDRVTAFEHIQYGDELERCQRYYQRFNGYPNLTFGVGNVDGSTQGQIHIKLLTRMRSKPHTLETSGTASDYGFRVRTTQNCTGLPAIPSNVASDNSVFLEVPSSSHGFSDGQAAFLVAQNSDAYLGFSAEL